MAEIGLLASVVGVAGAALTSSRALFEMVDDIRNAPEELSAISKDIHSFHDVVSSVQMAIRDRLVIKALLGDKKLCELVTNLEAPLQNCSSILTQLKPRIEPHLKARSDGKFRVSSIDLRWLLKKKDIIDCRNRLEVTKSTLDAALTSVIFFCSLRSAGQDVDSVSVPDLSPINRDLDAGSVLREYAESIAPQSPSLGAVYTIDPIEIPAHFNNKSSGLDAEDAGTIDPIELPAQSINNSTELDAEAAGTMGSVGIPAQLNKGSAELDAEEQEASNGNSSSSFSFVQILRSLFLYTRTPQTETSSSAPTTGEQATYVLNTSKTSVLGVVAAMIRKEYDINQFDGSGETALHTAAKEGREDIVRELLANNADVNIKSQPGNLTPLWCAACDNHKSIVEILLDNGADTAVRFDDGNTALDLSIRKGHDDTAIALIQRLSTLIDRANTKYLPLQHAIRHNQPRVVEALIARGKQLGQLEAMLDARDKRGWTPLALASLRRSIEIVSQLLAAGANIEEREPEGWTPLLAASSMGRFEMVDFLIAQGADRQATGNCGEDYLEILEGRHPKKYEEYMGKVKS